MHSSHAAYPISKYINTGGGFVLGSVCFRRIHFSLDLILDIHLRNYEAPGGIILGVSQTQGFQFVWLV